MAACALLLLLAPAAQVAGPAVRREVCGCDGGRSAAVGERARRRPPSCRALLLAHAPQLCACVCSSRVRLVLALFAGPCYDACMLSLCRWHVITLIVQEEAATQQRQALHHRHMTASRPCTGAHMYRQCTILLAHLSELLSRGSGAVSTVGVTLSLQVTANEHSGSPASSFLVMISLAWR